MAEGYVDFLIGEYVARKNSNARYSERAFAQSLGLSAGFLKLLFQGKKQLSLERAKDIVSRLNLKEPKRGKFLRSVQSSSSKSTKLLSGKFLLEQKDFFEISDWFCFAILELVKVKSGKLTPDEISKELGISKTEALFAIKQLTQRGLLTLQGNSTYSAPKEYEMPSISSEAIKRFHRQMLILARASVDEQKVEDRDLRGLTLAFDKERIEEARKDIQKFVLEFERKYGSEKPDSVYQLSLALFQLNKGGV